MKDRSSCGRPTENFLTAKHLVCHVSLTIAARATVVRRYARLRRVSSDDPESHREPIRLSIDSLFSAFGGKRLAKSALFAMFGFTAKDVFGSYKTTDLSDWLHFLKDTQL